MRSDNFRFLLHKNLVLRLWKCMYLCMYFSILNFLKIGQNADASRVDRENLRKSKVSRHACPASASYVVAKLTLTFQIYWRIKFLNMMQIGWNWGPKRKILHYRYIKCCEHVYTGSRHTSDGKSTSGLFKILKWCRY